MATGEITVKVTVQPDEATAEVLGEILGRLIRIEGKVDTAAQQIEALTAQSAAQGAQLTDLRNDVIAMREILEAERENLSPDAQSKMDALVAEQNARSAQIADLDLEVGDADGSDTPAPPAPVEGSPEG